MFGHIPRFARALRGARVRGGGAPVRGRRAPIQWPVLVTIDEARVRADFPLLRQPIVYLDSAATSLKPQVVIEAVREYLSDYSGNVHRGQHALSERASRAYEASRERVARFIGARASEVVFVRGTTEAINVVAAGLQLAPDDNVVATVLEHHSNLLPWRTRCAVRLAPLLDSGLPDLAAAEAAIDERTRIVAVSGCSNVTGARVPVAQWAAMAHRHGVPLLVDAAQSAAHWALDVEALGCDYLAFSGHKLLAPPGVGVLYGQREALARLVPSSLGGGCVTRVGADLSYELRELPWRLEAGTPDIAAVIGLGAAIEYLDDLGMDAIAGREADLRARLDAELAALPGLRLLLPTGERAPLLSLCEQVPAMGAEYLARVLGDSFGIMTRAGHHCAHPLHAALGLPATLRVSLAFYNSEDELGRLGAALRGILRGRGG